MPRIRSIHPGIWTDEAFVSVSQAARLLYIGLLNECDDQGVFQWSPLRIKMRLAPVDSIDVSALLAEMEGANMVRRYEMGGASYGAVRNFRKWQRPEKPKAVHPLPADLRSFVGLSQSDAPGVADTRDMGGGESPTDRRPIADRSPTGGRKSPQREEGGGKEDSASLRSAGAAAPPIAESQPEPPSGACSPPSEAVSKATADPKPPDLLAELFDRGRRIVAELLPGQSDADHRKLLGRLRKQAGDRVPIVLDALRDAERFRPSDAASWLTAAVCERLARLPADAEKPPDPWGFSAWAAGLPDAVPGEDRLGRTGPTLNGWCLLPIVEDVCAAAGIGDDQRPRLDAVAEWARADIDATQAPALDAIQRQARRMGEQRDVIRSLAVFNSAVRGATVPTVA